MKILLSALVAASLIIPTTTLAQSPGNQGGNSATKRQDTTGGTFETRGECERAAQRANADNKRDGIAVRNECVEEDGKFMLRATPTTTPS